LLTRLHFCLFGYYCRLREDFISIKIRRWQHGTATPFDYALLGHIHQSVLARLKKIPAAEAGPDAATEANIGLHNDRVAIAPPDPAWSGMAEAEAARLRDRLAPFVVEIHHIGSTSIPGLPAKPIIDLAVGLTPPVLEGELPAVIRLMEQAGYHYLGDWKRRGGHFFESASQQVRTHAVQVHPADGRDLRRLLRFRELMRHDPGLLREYSQVKSFLAQTLPHQRGLYFWYKGHWLNDLLLEENGPRAWGAWWISARYPTMLQYVQRAMVRTLLGGRRGPHPLAT
jgi:GrpB-like predicted nucleotidyltransferase (UPF0157 family)